MISLAALGSVAVLGGAFAFQYLGGLLPCPMCLWQRWPHAVAIGIGALGLALPLAALAWAGAVTMVVGAGLGLFHTGVERDWWEGPQTCAASAAQDLGAMAGSDLLDFTTGPQIVMCDEVAWSLLGLSMASWNAVACVILAGVWLAAARRT